MKFLRTAPTGRLLAVIAGLAIAAVGGTAIAIAAAGSGPVPPQESLAIALHRAAQSPPAAGVSARVTLTNNLIGSGFLQGVDPLLSGASGRLWAGDGHLRLELQGDNGDAQIVIDKNSYWIYDPVSNTIYRGSLPPALTAGTGVGRAGAAAAGADRSAAIPTVAQIQSYLTRLAGHMHLSDAIPTDVGGAASYAVHISPTHNGGMLGGVRLAWDADNGVPLDIAVYARGVGAPVLELRVTDVSFGKISPSDYTISPPPGANPVTVNAPGVHPATAPGATPRLNFPLDAPAAVAGMARGSVQRVVQRGSPTALVHYGRGLGGIVVIERAVTGQAPAGPGIGGLGLMLPTAQVNGATATELPTALGTLLQFTRGGISYLLAGSVPPPVSIAAARGL
jgi:outer membrane lipoprotein-sorting protein